MKKIGFYLIMLLTVFGFYTNVSAAEVISVGKENYVDGKDLYCGEDTVSVYGYLKSQDKILVTKVNDPFKRVYVWSYDETCERATTDELFAYSNQMNYSEGVISDSVDAYITTEGIIQEYFVGYVLNDQEYDEYTTYYLPGLFDYNAVSSEDYNEALLYEYYVEAYFRRPDSTTLDENTTYYVQDEYDDTTYRVEHDLEHTDVRNLYVMTSDIEIFTSENTSKSISMDSIETLVNNIEDGASFTVMAIDGEFYVMIETLEGDKYYDMNGNEITEFAGMTLYVYNNYVLAVDAEGQTINVYNLSFELIKTYEFDGDTSFSVTEVDYDIYITVPNENTSETYYLRCYKVLNGDNQTFTDSDITIDFSGHTALFGNVYVNGDIELDSENYTYDGRLTSITLSKEYLSTLTPGTYRLTVNYTDGGYADATFIIKEEEVVEVYYTVEFENNDHGIDVPSQTVKENETATKPEDLTEEGYTFTGWYEDKELTKTYDFSTKITSNTTIYAGWKQNEVIENPKTLDNINVSVITESVSILGLIFMLIKKRLFS